MSKELKKANSFIDSVIEDFSKVSPFDVSEINNLSLTCKSKLEDVKDTLDTLESLLMKQEKEEQQINIIISSAHSMIVSFIKDFSKVSSFDVPNDVPKIYDFICDTKICLNWVKISLETLEALMKQEKESQQSKP